MYHLYADDSQLYFIIDKANPNSTFVEVERLVDIISGWMKLSFMQLNSSKTEIMIISSRYSHCRLQHTFELADNCLITPSSSLRSLGANLMSDMSVNDHVTGVCRQSVRMLRSIARIRKFLSVDTAHAVARALVISRIDYHNSLLVGSPRYQLRRLQRIQNWAARLVYAVGRTEHATPLLRNLHWLPIDARITFKICVFVYRILHGNSPGYLTDLVNRYNPVRSLRSSKDSSRLAVPRSSSSTHGDRTFSVAAPRLWYPLPVFVKSAETEMLFRCRLKTHLFRLTL